MLTLHADLLAAQRRSAATPVVQVIARHAEGGGQYLPRFQQVYAGAQTDNFHAAAVTASGALIRAWATPTNRLLVERSVITADGTPQLAFGTNWIQVSAAAKDTAGCAIATFGTTVLLFAVLSTDATKIQMFTSTDDGATFDAGATLFTEGAAVTHLAAVGKAGGTTALIWNTGATGGGTGATLRGARRSAAGAWSAAVSSALSAGDIFGVAVLAGAAFGVVVAGRTPNSGGAPLAPRLWGMDFTDAAPPVWGTAVELEKAESGLVDKYEWHAPFLLNADRPRMTVQRSYFGHVARLNDIALTALAYPGYAVTQRKWREPTIAETTRPYGLAIAGPGGGFGSGGGDYLWLTSPARILRAPAVSPTYDLSGDILSLRADWTPGGGTLDLTLDDHTTEYNVLADGADNPFAALTVGSELIVSLGYRTASGVLTVQPLPLFRVTRIDRQFEAGRKTVRIHARDALHWLDRWRNPSQIVVAAATDDLAEVLEQITSRAGYALYGSAAPLQARKPALTFNPNDTGLAIARRIVARVGQALFDQQGNLTLRDLDAAEATVYAYES